MQSSVSGTYDVRDVLILNTEMCKAMPLDYRTASRVIRFTTWGLISVGGLLIFLSDVVENTGLAYAGLAVMLTLLVNSAFNSYAAKLIKKMHLQRLADHLIGSPKTIYWSDTGIGVDEVNETSFFQWASCEQAYFSTDYVLIRLAGFRWLMVPHHFFENDQLWQDFSDTLTRNISSTC